MDEQKDVSGPLKQVNNYQKKAPTLKTNRRTERQIPWVETDLKQADEVREAGAGKPPLTARYMRTEKTNWIERKMGTQSEMQIRARGNCESDVEQWGREKESGVG